MHIEKLEEYCSDIEKYYNRLDANKKALDSIDLVPFLEKHEGGFLANLRFELENIYNGTELTKNEYLEGRILDQMPYEEFIEYLVKRYGEKYVFPEYTFNVIRKKRYTEKKIEN